MFRNKTILALLALLPLLAGCGGSGSADLFAFDADYLAEDVLDLMANVFQTGENAFLGDPVQFGDVLDPAAPGNGFAVLYELPAEFRPGLGFGYGDVVLRVTEDGFVHDDPLFFSFATTDAFLVELVYDLRYAGETESGRTTDIGLVVTLTARRPARSGAWMVEYFVEGDGFLGDAWFEISTRFRAPGGPRDGVEPGFGDGYGVIDDPDLPDLYDLALDFGDVAFRVSGDVGAEAYFDEDFFYWEIW